MTTLDRIIQLREHLNLSQRQFAKRIGKSGTHISHIESGNAQVTDNLINAIVVKLNVSRTWLETGEGEMFAPRQGETTPEWAQELMRKLDKLMEYQANMNKLIDLLGKPSGKHVSAVWPRVLKPAA